ncbi:LuxR C-terminal-related transcriptional regulator [Amycolatopsis sp.]|uniref:LuxR C-terminal-related transcriptional regulator n=1 Tax=Amycolatopsis sp. TaxID=37632 RepID=UPI0039C8BD21
MESLAPRAREVLTFADEGLSNQDISGALFVSGGAVKPQVGALLTSARPEQPRPGGRPGTR